MKNETLDDACITSAFYYLEQFPTIDTNYHLQGWKTYKLILRKNNNAISKSNGLFIYRIFIKSIL